MSKKTSSNYTDNISVTKALLITLLILFGIGIVHVIASGTQNSQQSPNTTSSNQGSSTPAQAPSQQPAVVNIPPGTFSSPLTQPQPASNSSGPSDSSGYDAGYNYAEEYQICDPTYSNGKSQDFNDGVNAWTADNCTDGQPN